MTELAWRIVRAPKRLSVHVPTTTPSFLAPPDSVQNTTLGRLLSVHVPTTTPFQTPVHARAAKTSFPCSHRDPNSAAPPPRTNSPSVNANHHHPPSLRDISPPTMGRGLGENHLAVRPSLAYGRTLPGLNRGPCKETPYSPRGHVASLAQSKRVCPERLTLQKTIVRGARGPEP